MKKPISPSPDEEEPEDVSTHSPNNNPTPHDESMIKPTPLESEENLDVRIMINELTARTNKSEEQLHLELERELAAAPPAIKIDPASPPAEICWVEIPAKVTVALRNLIASNDLPIDDLTRDWLEAEVAEHNGVPAEHIAADDCIIRTGKSWRYVPESAKANTGFSFYPEL